jgi:RNA-directed DNA polymerase
VCEKAFFAQNRNSGLLTDGMLIHRDKGPPQREMVSPLLANLFLYYYFDNWMKRQYSEMSFGRYADDVIVRCKTQAEAKTTENGDWRTVREVQAGVSFGEDKNNLL